MLIEQQHIKETAATADVAEQALPATATEKETVAVPPETAGGSYFSTQHLKSDLKGRSARGGMVTFVAQGLKFALTMASTIILARLLTPQDYGLIGMVAVVTGFISLFKDLGLSSATVQRAEINHEQISLLFWLNVAASLFIMLLTAAIAPLVARFYGEPRLAAITVVIALGFIFGGLTVQHQALLQRQMRFATLALIDILALAAGPITAILMALRGFGYWSLVGGQLATGVVTAVGVWLACGWRPSRPRKGAGVRSMLAFGGNLTGFGVINYFARNLDNMLIGRVWGAQQLGLYAKAYQLLLLPIDQINSPVTAVAVPTLSRLADEPERYRQAYVRMLEKVCLLTMPGVAFMLVTSDWCVRLLLGAQWADSARIFTLLGIAGLIQPVANTTGWLFVSQGRTHHMLRWGLMAGSATIAAIVAGLPWGAIGVAASYSVMSGAVGLCGRSIFIER
jgi:PST family polysaccharide transporter